MAAPRWLRWAPVPFSAFLSLVSFLVYFSYRFRCIVVTQEFRRRNLFFAWVFLAVELLTLIPNTLAFLVRASAFRPPRRKKLRLLTEGVWGPKAPAVDVFVTCCGEDVDEIMATLKGVCALDYPPERYRVFILDDGNSKQLGAAVAELDAVVKLPPIHYVVRKKGPVKDYKAGNLNNGVRVSNQLGQGAELVAGLDADMIPEPAWLRALVPHFQDEKMGCACPPQLFYNLPSPDMLNQDLALWHRVNEHIADSMGTANCTGSGWVMRRKALEDIDGFPIDTLAEDTKCSALMLSLGWKTALVLEPLQYGRVPESLRGHIKQRTRWFIGHVQNAVQLGFFLFGSRGRNLNWMQWTSGVSEQLSAVFVCFPVIVYISIPLALLGGYPFVVYHEVGDLIWLLRFAAVYQICAELHTLSLRALIEFSEMQTSIQIEGWLLPYYAIAFAQTFILPKGFGGRQAGFSASGSISNELHERDPRRRAPLKVRLKTVLGAHLGWIHLLFVLSCVLGVGLNLGRATGTIGSLWAFTSTATVKGVLINLLPRIGWPPLIWLIYTISAMRPLLYAIFPPTDLGALGRTEDQVRGTYPQWRVKPLKSKGDGNWEAIKSVMAIVYGTVVLIISLYLW